MKYQYQLKTDCLDFEDGVEVLKKKFTNPVVVGNINNLDPDCVNWIINTLVSRGISVKRIRVDRKGYLKYIIKAEYKTKYPEYYINNFFEKTFEHYLCYHFLDLKQNEKFIDIASEHSPVVDIFSNLTGCIGYSQDIMYNPGIHDNKIGSNASEIPVPDEFFNGAIATCSIEHFENDSDILFMREMERLLIKGGKIIIAPLYIYSKSSCQTDPRYSIPGSVSFDNEAIIYCAKDWGNRHGRFYSPESLIRRLIKPNTKLEFVVYIIENLEEIDKSLYCKFILVGTHI
ncbi:Methyltransferase type 11 [Methanolacinia petrolearia DSM 11571]|uniref:Methyltransferase type 11 n=1 Tax=Methanolacinia petrolearia (strain DSM 11571 / OCM 486 / SEBR 4847) TaxID=679926 RepID=E1REZ0_METP4|nr:methyltransferase domain-containing protein [Methanolacinia petrolearia]ADN36161.1 Methyltransferase type 11 [Methanolacinia petrolearia DSM 11571]